ncbi:hypothetical protein WA026_020010 [Henosepilachna vigintioctopunctata]|uniref:Uncharacterized protein n=1 Tax=Henosepilachna vigintioctopunctata TaxID=420089 RepID=A0AAW1V4M3_9CUCU
MYRYSIVLVGVVVAVAGLPDSEPLFSFNNGRIGVNFLGYKASAGLGGLLTGNAADGGLFASAKTPHGQEAVAGGIGRAGNSLSAGGLYAGAKTGYGQHASTGIGGIAAENNAIGGTFAKAGTGYGHKAGVGLAGSTSPDVNDGLRKLLNSLFGKQ